MRPETEAEVAQVIRAATGTLSAIGGGTRLLPGEGQGARIDTRGLTGIALYEPAALTLVVRAGTLMADVRAALAAEGQHLAFEPPAEPGSTIGGIVAANASGPRRVQSGACRDSMLGVRFVDGQGVILANGGRVMKNVTGYDLVKLMSGSRGKLGVLTEIAFKTAPLPPVTQTLTLPDLDAAAAIAALTTALSGPFDVSGAAWLPETGAMLRLEGLPQSVALRSQALSAAMSAFGSILTNDDPALWDFQRDANIPGSGAAPRDVATKVTWRIVCRPSQAADILAGLASRPRFIDWGGALIHADLPAHVTPELPAGAIGTRLSGTSGGLPQRDPVILRLEAGLRQRFDPRGLFMAA